MFGRHSMPAFVDNALRP